ncbi:Plasmodium exported protein (Pm-fam-a like), unknown function [Plasmodium malariae]|uniref:Uncharacterized protein n=1 Tax=Plasmodium malariae TaxID=5858 RepID=A0A1A8X706_PLAMA|nr:Plasmodium exported protein (Pm-fam-a like), unknown function [Plasmodium malariae]
MKSNFNKYVCEKLDIDGKLGIITYRLLAKYKQGRRSNTVWIKENISSKVKCDKKDRYNEKTTKGKNIQTDKCSLNCGEDYKIPKSIKPCMYKGRNLYGEKRVFDKILYKNTVRDVTKDDFKFLRERIKVKLFGIFILGSFQILVGIILLVLGNLGYLEVIDKVLLISNNRFLSGLVFIMFTLIVGAVMFYLHRIFEKYLKALEKKSDLHNTMYPSLHIVVKYNKEDL